MPLAIKEIRYKKNRNQKTYKRATYEETKPQYKIKEKYITETEEKFGNAFKEIILNQYVIYPQVPLSQIVEKETKTKYQSELNRIIDFCIFSKEYKPLVCIEINDETHKQKERYIRDRKVKDILDNAQLPLITLWTSYGINKEYIEKRLKEHLDLD
jgi:hypothetical protein